MKLFICIPLRVHCWGGLGSQSYALATVHDLKLKYPKRRIKLVLHTGGVTKRVSKLDFIPNIDFRIIQVNDYRVEDKEYGNQVKSNEVKLKRFLIRFLYYFNFIVSANSILEFNKVRPWTVSTSFYSYLLEYVKSEEKQPKRSQFEIAIHYRMGDLLTLTNKSILPADKIIAAVKQAKKSHNDLKIYVYSDSPKIARETLFNAGLTDEFKVSNRTTIDVIRECVHSNYFIGTGSKVSLWIVNIRRYMGEIDSNYLEGFDGKLFNQR